MPRTFKAAAALIAIVVFAEMWATIGVQEAILVLLVIMFVSAHIWASSSDQAFRYIFSAATLLAAALLYFDNNTEGVTLNAAPQADGNTGYPDYANIIDPHSRTLTIHFKEQRLRQKTANYLADRQKDPDKFNQMVLERRKRREADSASQP